MIRFPIRVPIRFLAYFLLAILAVNAASLASPAQTNAAVSAQTPTTLPPPALGPLDRQELLRRIGIYEDEAREAGAAHASHETLAGIYRNLGNLYGDVGMYPTAEASSRRAIEWMKDGPQDQLAEEINHLSALHILMGKMREAEKDEMQALAICEKMGDPVGVALTWTHLSTLYYKEGQMKKSLEYAEKAYSVLADLKGLKASDRLGVLESVTFALCANHQCTQAIPIMKDAVAQAQTAYGEDSLSAGLASYVLGYVYWQCGDKTDAAEWMARGIKRMKVDLGWGHPLYVNAMAQYAKLLREAGQREEASNAENEVHRMQSVVDARTMTPRGDAFLSSGVQ